MTSGAGSRSRWTAEGVRRAFRLDGRGLVGAQVGSWVALSPSLIPREWWSTALDVAVSATGGYVAGGLLGRVIDAVSRDVGQSSAPDAGVLICADQVDRVRCRLPRGRSVLLAASIGVTAVMLARSEERQREIATLTGAPPRHDDRCVAIPGRQIIGFALGTGGWLGVVMAVHVGLTTRRATAYGLRRLSRRSLGPVTAFLAAGVVVTMVDLVVLNRTFEALAHRAFEENGRVLTGRRRPDQAERSGSRVSSEPFQTLGAHGQAMVNDGPRARDLIATATAPVREPIRVYAGRLAHADLASAAEAVVAELHRTAAFERSVLTVFTATGTGWVQEWSLSAIEHLTGGDCAAASMQYSYLPSWLAFLADRRRAREAGRLLLDRVRDEIGTLPPGRRPRLFVSGESLGAYGGQAAFADLDDMLARVDGAVWVGTPRSTALWRQLVGEREPGSTEVAPVVRGGRNVRFTTGPATARRDLDPCGWALPRIVYAQHASDPVVWWEPRLIWARPAWLRARGRRGPGASGPAEASGPVDVSDTVDVSDAMDVSDAVRWWPWVTCWQLGVDMARSVSVPSGHGHNYHEELVPIWAAVLDVDVPADRLRRIERAIRATIRPH